jgi:hypothetical protein
MPIVHRLERGNSNTLNCIKVTHRLAQPRMIASEGFWPTCSEYCQLPCWNQSRARALDHIGRALGEQASEGLTKLQDCRRAWL